MDDIPVVCSHCIAPVIQSSHLLDTAKGEKMTGGAKKGMGGWG
jgi:hypothetical protein